MDEKQKKTFKDQLLAGLIDTPVHQFSPLERRLIELANILLPNITIHVWTSNMTPEDKKLPELTDAVIMKAARLALIAAVQMDEQLQTLR